MATTGSPLGPRVAVGQFPHIADGLTPELVYISGGAQVVSTVSGLVNAGIWADVNNFGNIIFENVVGGFSQVFLAKPKTGMNSLAIDSGDQQDGFVNTTLPDSLTVTVTDPSGKPVAGVSISFTITQEPSGTVGSSLSTSNTTTAADGTASTQ